MALVLHRWSFDAAGKDPAAKRRQLVNEVVVPVFADAVRAGAECVYACKYAKHPPVGPHDEVQLTIVSLPADSGKIGAVVESTVDGRARLRGPHAERLDDRLCWDDCAWYRHRLTDVTGIALDLHKTPQFDEHRGFLLDIHGQGGLRAFTRASLHRYLTEHCPAYESRGEKAKEGFWLDFLRWGPAPGLSPPGHLLESLLLVE